jgi:hypothetical protein
LWSNPSGDAPQVHVQGGWYGGATEPNAQGITTHRSGEMSDAAVAHRFALEFNDRLPAGGRDERQPIFQGV